MNGAGIVDNRGVRRGVGEWGVGWGGGVGVGWGGGATVDNDVCEFLL